MTTAPDPPRLSAGDAESPELSALFRAGEADLPSGAQLRALQARLGPVLAPAGGAGGDLRRFLKVPRVGFKLGALVGLGVALSVALRSATVSTPSAVPSVSSAHALSPSAAATAPFSENAPPAPSAQPVETTPEVLPEPSLAPPETASSAATSRGNRVPQPGSVSEAALLEQARRALNSDPARALALTRQYQLKFPNGVLGQEREVIAIEALRRLGRTTEASERARSFSTSYPDSAHRRAVETGRAP